MSNINLSTTSITEILKQRYSLSGHLSALAYLNEISANLICGLFADNWNAAYSVISGISSYNLNTNNLAISTLADISSRCGSKVYIKNPDSSILSDGAESTLSVIKIAKDEFDSSIDILSDNALYVVDSDYIDAYGQLISNVSMGEDFNAESSFVSIAATKKYVDILLCETSCILSDLIDNKSNIFLSSISLSELIAGGKLDKLNIVKLDSYSTYELCSLVLGLSDLILIEEDNLNARASRIISVAEPEISSDAATKNYVDVQTNGIFDIFNSISSDSTISTFMENVNPSDGVDKIELEQAVSALYVLIKKLTGK